MFLIQEQWSGEMDAGIERFSWFLRLHRSLVSLRPLTRAEHCPLPPPPSPPSHRLSTPTLEWPPTSTKTHWPALLLANTPPGRSAVIHMWEYISLWKSPGEMPRLFLDWSGYHIYFTKGWRTYNKCKNNILPFSHFTMYHFSHFTASVFFLN